MKYYLGFADYVVIGISLLLSAGIGILAKVYGRKQESVKGYLMAGKAMPKIPVICSIVVTLVSPEAIIGFSAETYQYGAVTSVSVFSLPFGMMLAAWIFLPVYFQCEVSTVNEFLEIRFGRMIRYTFSGLFLVQMVFFMSTALYGAVLSLSAVTDLPLEISIVSLGVICAFYCSIGGLKAVLWTDAYQSILVVICMIAIYAACFHDAGNISKIYQNAKEGGRLNFFDFDMDLTKRYTFWNSFFRGLIFGFGFYGTNQLEVQRTLSMSTKERAQSSLRFSIAPAVIIYLLCSLLGVVVYSIFFQCDPILNKDDDGPEKYDQLIPWYIVKKYNSYPGMTGLCISGIFSASLSSISSALNSASTVTVVDFIKPLYKNGKLSDFKLVLLAKILSVVYGGLCIGLTFNFLDTKSIMQLGSVMITALEGPTFAIFLVGVLTRKACDKCVSFALIIGWLTMVWISFGALYSKHSSNPLPLSTSMCPVSNSTYRNTLSSTCANCDFVSTTTQLPPEESFFLYRISYFWHVVIGFILTLFLIFIGVLVTGWNKNVIPENSPCLSPVTRFWSKKVIQEDNVPEEVSLKSDPYNHFMKIET